jgi:hypothetical protein
MDQLKRMNRFLGAWHLCIASVVLLLSATAHRVQYDAPGYTSSPLIHVQIILMILIALIVCAHPFIGLFLCFRRRWKQLGLLASNTVTGIVAWVAAMIIDSPTLMYMT